MPATTNQIDQAMQRPAWQSPIMPLTDKLWILPQANRLLIPYTNTMLNLADDGLLSIESNQACISMDQGST